MLFGGIAIFCSTENNTFLRENKWNAYHDKGAYYYITCVKYYKQFTSTWKDEYYVRLVIFTFLVTLFLCCQFITLFAIQVNLQTEC